MVFKNEMEVRQAAIQRYQGGEPPAEICRDLGRSREWFFKWLRRSRSGQERWFEGQSRAPHRVQNKAPRGLEEKVIGIRERLMGTKYSQIGANAINWELRKAGQAAAPTSTINRMIARHDLKRPPPPPPGPKPNYVNWPCLGPNSMFKTDLVGPRFIKGDGRFYSLNVMDIWTHRVAINPVRTKADDQIVGALLRSFARLGLPDYLQMDNEVIFRGSNRHPHSFGRVIKLCLRLGIEPMFIPMEEPWRNGEIEKFNDVFDKMFYRSQFFESFAHLCEEAPKFEAYHNQHHVYSCLGGRTPNATLGEDQPTPLPSGFTVPKDNFLIDDGFVHLIRFIRSDRALNVFGEKFLVNPELVYQYVVATICTEIHQLQVRHDDRLIQWFDYNLPWDQVSAMSLDI